MELNNWKYVYKKNEKSKNKFKKLITVACVLGYFNGEKYIKEQLQSILNQKQDIFSITIFISDDNSNRNFSLLENFDLENMKNNEIYYRKLEKNIGYANNFIFSLRDINLEFDYFCFSDQDDIWTQNKIENALNNILKYDKKLPILYCGRTTYFDEKCEFELGNSLLFKKKPNFKNAIIQSLAGGNTMLFNRSAKDLIVSSIFEDFKIISHDWWCYQLITGAEGIVYYDKNSYVKYRQHRNNLLGSNNTLHNKFHRILSLISGKFKSWNDINLNALNRNKSILKKNNKKLVEDFIKYRNGSLFQRIFLLKFLGIYRQTFLGNLALNIAVVFKRV